MRWIVQPLSDELERRVRARLNEYKLMLVNARKDTALNPAVIHRLEGNIGATEWVLREAEAIKDNNS